MKAIVIKEINYGYNNKIKENEIVDILKTNDIITLIKYKNHKINVLKDKIKILEV